MPDPSFDLNGDGHISAREYFIAKQFDKNNDGKLDTEERMAAINAIKNVSFNFIFIIQGFEDNFVWGIDQSGT